MLSNDMKLVFQKNHLGGQIPYRSWGTSKKRRLSFLGNEKAKSVAFKVLNTGDLTGNEA